MIVKAEKPRFDELGGAGAQALEGGIDVSLNIGTSANAGTASMSRATELFDEMEEKVAKYRERYNK